MIKPVIVLGAGGHAKVLINALQLSSVEILGITDPDPALVGQKVLGVPIIGTDDELQNHSAEKVQLVNGLGSVDLPMARCRLFDECKKLGFVFATVIHPAAVVASDVEIGEGSQVMAGAVLQPGACIGYNVIINTRASVDHDCHIGNHTHIAPGVTLSGEVIVGSGSHVGSGSSVVQGVSVGDSCLVGAGSVVLKDLPSGVKAYGCPAKVVER
jgi:sugar O-acyltransferase (sialic acid O-acetyltransferase NeuD family)